MSDEEDKEIWERYTADMKPSKAPQEENFEALLDEVQAEHEGEKSEESEKTVSPKSASIQNKKDGTQKQSFELDRKTEEKLRKGQMRIEGKIDLHGMRQGEAFEALNIFIEKALHEGRRCLLVITGKGKTGSTSEDWLSPARGILKTRVPEWLRSGPHQNAILKVVEAAPKHGGSGAYYIYLRRRQR